MGGGGGTARKWLKHTIETLWALKGKKRMAEGREEDTGDDKNELKSCHFAAFSSS